MKRLLPIRTLSLLAACAAVTLLGCDGGLDFDNASLPDPSIAIGPPPVTCSTAGSGTIGFEIQDITVTENFPGATPQNRMDVTGTVSGLAMGDELLILLLPYSSDCPLQAVATATTDGTTFSARIDFGEGVAFRAVLVSHSGLPEDITCTSESACLATAAGSFSAVSDSIEVLLQ